MGGSGQGAVFSFQFSVGRVQGWADENRVFQLTNGFSTNPTRKRGNISSPRLRVGLVFSSAQFSGQGSGPFKPLIDTDQTLIIFIAIWGLFSTLFNSVLP